MKSDRRPNIQNVPLTAAEARQIALRRLAAREYSAADMVAYLRRKGVDPKIAQEIVATLVAAQLISDERYARVMTRHQLMRGKGPGYIRMKLKQKGVHAEMSDVRELAEEVSGESELERARRIVETRYPSAHNDKTVAARAYQALLRRGFSFDTARAAVLKNKDTEE